RLAGDKPQSAQQPAPHRAPPPRPNEPMSQGLMDPGSSLRAQRCRVDHLEENRRGQLYVRACHLLHPDPFPPLKNKARDEAKEPQPLTQDGCVMTVMEDQTAAAVFDYVVRVG